MPKFLDERRYDQEPVVSVRPSNASPIGQVPPTAAQVSSKPITRNPNFNAQFEILTKSKLLGLLRLANAEPSGLLAGVLVFVVSGLICWTGWWLFSAPGRMISSIVSPGDCGALATGTLPMYFCSAKVALLTLAGPLAMMSLLIIFRRWITAQVGKWARKLPAESRLFLGPLVACVVFAFAWAPIHYQVVDDSGLVSQRIFPGVVAVFTYASVRYGPKAQQILTDKSFFEWRDRLSPFVRGAIAVLIPLTVSLVITFQDRVSQAAFKEQVVTLVGLFTGYLALTPRQGDWLGAVQQMERRSMSAQIYSSGS